MPCITSFTMNARVADLQLGMHDLAVRTKMAADFLGTERSLVPLDRLRRVIQHQVGSNRVKTIGYGLRCFCHDTSCVFKRITMKRIEIGCKMVNGTL